MTLGIFLSGALPWLHAVLYVIAQLLGGTLGALFTRVSLILSTERWIQGKIVVSGVYSWRCVHRSYCWRSNHTGN
ncbi:MAG: hypothetical protein GY696_39635 [Gammaproteobacteria bacterium]|nr:hypothetical protein [Gammaproteobacteria bacterium]